jgi:histone acetyltransferase (RNA polymerase elongator complex component)
MGIGTGVTVFWIFTGPSNLQFEMKGQMSTPPVIFPIFLPNLGCRERCLFCNQRAAPEDLLSPSSVRDLIENSLDKFPSEGTDRKKQIAFYGGSFTAIHRDDQVRYLRELQPLLSSGLIDSIRLSTRPDALDEETLSLLKQYGVKTVEVGVQSMIDEVLFLSGRGHRAEDTVSATSRLKQWGFEVGHHLMIGLPGDSCNRFLQTLDRIIELKPDFVRIHPTLVLKGAPLENLWRAREYSPLSLDGAIQWLKKGVLKLEKASIPVARIGLQPTKELERDFLAGPYHPALRHLVDSAIFLDMATSLLQTSPLNGHALLLCHPKEISNLRGQRNENILKLKTHFNLNEILIEGREELLRGTLRLKTQRGEVSVHRKSLVF